MQRRTFLASAATVPALIAQAEPHSPTKATKPFIVKVGEARSGIHTPFRGVSPNDVKISGKDTNGQLAVFEYSSSQKIGPSLHVHHEQDEIFFIVEGEYLFQIGHEKFTVKTGDTVFAPRGIPHTWLQLSDHGRQLYMVQPAGSLEAFFLKMSALKSPPTEELSQRLHKEHGMTVVGPPLTVK